MCLRRRCKEASLAPRAPSSQTSASPTSAPRRRGELLLGRYLLQERLGAGGFGTVWRAHDEQLDRAVAVKRIPLPSEEDRERATREAHATARLAHPAIVALYEASSDEDAFYLISELIDGATLAELISEDELADEEVLEIGVALLSALEHAHARGVIHRDVKPQNVLVPSDAAEHTPTRGASPAAGKARGLRRSQAGRRRRVDAHRGCARHACLHGPRAERGSRGRSRRRSVLAGARSCTRP